MRLYWPVAVVIDNGKERDQWTYDACISLDRAIGCIQKWNEMFDCVKSAYIDVEDTETGKKSKISICLNMDTLHAMENIKFDVRNIADGKRSILVTKVMKIIDKWMQEVQKQYE